MSESCRNQYFLHGYISFNNPIIFVRDKIKYTIQRYQGEHKNEFLLRSETGEVCLFENNVLKQKWQENEREVKSDTFTVYKNGRVHFSQRFDDILKHRDSYCTVYHKRGLRMEIWSAKTGHLIYHGEYNDNRKRLGWGIEYDEESGNVVVEGIWINGELTEVIRCFNGDTMTELRRNGVDSLDPTKRIPIYVGGFRYDEDNETFIREGKGCLIDEKTGIATRECEWKDGEEVSGVDLYDGRYIAPYIMATNVWPNEFDYPSIQLVDLTIASNCCNEVNKLDVSKFKWLQTIEIGGDSFGLVKTFHIDGLNRLKTVNIGKNSFTQKKKDYGNDASKLFHILNCESLESLEIGEYSFSDYGGGFELKNCPQLRSLQIGHIKKDSFNFCFCSFEIQGIVSAHSYSICRSSLSETNCVRELCIPASFNHHYQEYRIFIDQTMDRSPLVAIHRAWTRSSGWERL